MSSHPKIVVLDRLQTGESANPSPENILAGIPRARVSNQYAEPTQQFFCGIWTSTAGKWRVRYTEHEFCVIIEGRVRVESSKYNGQAHTLTVADPGDAEHVMVFETDGSRIRTYRAGLRTAAELVERCG